MEPNFRHYQINHTFQEKDSGYYYWKLRKKKVKRQTLFRNYSNILARSLSTIKEGRPRAVDNRKCLRGNCQELARSTGTIPK